MYIEFSLPKGRGGQSAAHANMIINNELVLWSEKYQIPYTTKIVKHLKQSVIKRVVFEQDQYYSVFAMTWNPQHNSHILSKWRTVSDLNNKTSFDDVV